MKNTLTGLFLLGSIGYFGYTVYNLSLGPCAKPIEYSIGRFDTNFGVSKDVFMKDVLKAESVWESVVPDKQFFKYNPESEFKINLIYDERQKTIEQKQRTEFGLSAEEDRFKAIDAQFDLMKSAYEAKSRAYEQNLASFKRESTEYERQVQYWNSKKGAPPEEYNKLTVTKDYLNNRVKELNAEASQLNTMNAELNVLLMKRNEAAKQYNALVASYNKKFGSGLEFDQAEYTGEAINVYEFKNNTDLTLALAHELGHALGLDHVENNKSIMYYLTGNQNLALTDEDLAEFKKVCRIK